MTAEQLQANAHSMQVDRILRETGYANVARLPEHDATIDELARLVPHAGNARPLHHAPGHQRPQVATLLRQLPPTPEVESLLTFLQTTPTL